MHKYLLLLLIVLWAVTLTGCQASSSGSDVITPSLSVTQATPSAFVEMTVAPIETEETKATQTLTLTAAPTPTEIQSLECGEVFCSVQWGGVLDRPIAAGFRNLIDLTYPYANTRNRTMDSHHGVEFVNSAGTPVLAAQAGEVVYAGGDDLTLLGPYTNFYGNVVILKHPGLYQGRDLFTLYGHLSAILVNEGALIGVGETIGEVGASGAADGSHLHFEVRLDVNDYAHTTNPVLWFSPVTLPEIGQTSMLAGIILDRGGNPISEFQVALEKLDESGMVEANYYPITYYPVGVNSHPALGENFAFPDLPPGDYRLALISGKYYEVNLTLMPGELGFIKLQLD
jgi:murein DD-endopeptidase MepM/ murein hydrolase activator NlpD